MDEFSNVFQQCTNGGFETGLGQYNFTHQTLNNFYGGQTINTFTAIPPTSNFFPNNATNTVNSPATLVSQGNDPTIPFLQRTNNNSNRAIRLNYIDANHINGFIDVTTMNRTFVCNEANFNYNFSLILENPFGHATNDQPFFSVRILETEDCSITLGDMDLSSNKCDECKLKTIVVNVHCEEIDGFKGYKVRLQFDNMYGFQIGASLTVPNGEGYFVNNSISLPNGLSTDEFFFYPQNGFSGGNVSVIIQGEWNDNLCVSQLSLQLPQCAFRPASKGIGTSGMVEQFFVAPNPASNQAMVYYRVIDNSKKFNLVVLDLTGRQIMVKPLSDLQGRLPIDCTRLAAGMYMVCLQQDQQTIKSTKLIVEK